MKLQYLGQLKTQFQVQWKDLRNDQWNDAEAYDTNEEAVRRAKIDRDRETCKRKDDPSYLEIRVVEVTRKVTMF